MRFALLLALAGFAAAEDRAVRFEQFTQYAEKNNSGLTGETSYLVFSDEASFDRVFLPTAFNGPNKFLSKDDFQKKLIVAAIGRGSFLRKFTVASVTLKDGTLFVRYSVEDKETPMTRFAAPLILAVEKAGVSKVVFLEEKKVEREVPR